ncbi:hypothetical protein E8E14_001179 [Neopestalotiopsis sp. 37M]|nr:hypothetical protein E8E14_001179 [Neopestalotiopsis sp. 37M]
MARLANKVLGAYCLLATCVRATVYVTSTASFPDNITQSCSNALVSDLNCPSGIEKLRKGLFYPASFLSTLCTTDCSGALASYESDVTAACEGETYDTLTDADGWVPLYTIPQYARYVFNYTCLSDATDGEYCNVKTAESIGIYANQSNLNSIDVGTNLSCSDCDLKQYQFLAGAAFYHDDDTVAEYSSLTSSCSATGYPLSTTTFAFESTATATTTGTGSTPTCTGSSYTIQADDTCESISKSQSVGTMWLLLDNNLPAYCSDFPSSGSLCIQHTCNTYTVQTNDTCDSIQKAYGINYAQILAWNPQFDLTCGNIDVTVGLEICVSSPGRNYTSPIESATTTVMASATTAAPVPTNAASGSTANCGNWYEAAKGDYCNQIIIRYGISLVDFLILNPEVNENCTNLYAFESYCMEPVGDISNYEGAPGYISSVAWTTTVDPSSLPTATYIPDQYVSEVITYANGTRTDCATYISGADYQKDLSNTTFVSNCDLALTVFGITYADLTVWNPSLASFDVSECEFNESYNYCVTWSSLTVTTPSSVVEESSIPTATDTPSDCTSYTFVHGGTTCDDILQVYEISLAYFYSLNPIVGEDCSGLSNYTYYCVNSTSNPAVPTTATTVVTPPGPTQTGIASNCNAYYVAQTNDDCGTVEAAYGITDAQFKAWNPAVSSDCLTGFWADEAYCVGVSDDGSSSASITSSITAVSSTTTASFVTAPGPTQTGIPANCNAYYVAQTNDDCGTVEAAFGISDADFHAWNPAVSSDCLSGFWADEAYCVGVSGSGSSTTAVTTATPTSVTPPGPTQTGIPAKCNAYYVAQTGDDCGTVEAAYGITDAQFKAWNPAVSADCLSGFWKDEAYCVGLSS